MGPRSFADDRAIEAGASLSGLERNRLFLSLQGKAFANASGVSGLDHLADGRSLAILDFDRDGFSDFVVINANEPRTLLYRNRIGERAAAAGAPAGRSFALRLVGGNHRAEPSREWSNRDAVGAVVEVAVGDKTLLRHRQIGEGRGAQNSATLLVGIGERDVAQSVTVRWPSGRSQVVEQVRAGTLLTVYENPDHGPEKVASTTGPYLAATRRVAAPAAGSVPDTAAPMVRVSGPAPQSDLVLYTTMATWCLPCLEELPALREVRDAFDGGALAMVGVPYDANETRAELTGWEREHEPPYAVATTLPRADADAIKQVLLDALRFDALPATLVTDRDGRVLLTRFGPPTVSEIRRLLASAR